MGTQLVDLVGKMVQFTVASENGGDNESYEARLEQVTEFAAVVRPKGQRGAGALKLVKPDLILKAEAIVEPPRQIKAKRLKPIDASTARRHLLDAHFWLLTDANNLTDEQAVVVHDQIKHDGMGHAHDRGEADPNRGHREPCIGGHLCGGEHCPPEDEVPTYGDEIEIDDSNDPDPWE